MHNNTAELITSSPDPLNDELMYQSPAKPRQHIESISRSFALNANSPRKQTFQLDVGDRSSPHRIRVTVEADSDKENTHTSVTLGKRKPTINWRNERTTTTKIPLKGLNDDSDSDTPALSPKRGRGRPTRDAATLVRNSTRASTPAGRRRSIGSVVDGDDEEDLDFRIGAGVELSRGKGRSRSKSGKANKRKPNPGVLVTDSGASAARGIKHKTLMLNDIGSEGIGNTTISNNEEIHLRTPRSSRSPIPYDSITLHEHTSTDLHSPTVPEKDIRLRQTSRTTPPPDDTSSITSSSKSASVRFEKHLTDLFLMKQPGQDEELTTLYADDFDLQADEMPEFDTIMESEGFSMISVDSVPSLREHLSSPPNQNEAPHAFSTPDTQAPRPASVHESTATIERRVEPASGRSQLESITSRRDHRPLDSAAPLGANRTPASRPLAARIHLLRPIPAVADASFSTIPSSVLAAATPRPALRNKILQRPRLQDKPSNDSFSSVGSDILLAATPAKLILQDKSTTQIPSSTGSIQTTTSKECSPVVHQIELPTKSTVGKLATPSETLSPILTTVHLPQAMHQPLTVVEQQENKAAQSIVASNSSVLSNMRSSPPSAVNKNDPYSKSSQLNDSVAAVVSTPQAEFSSPTLPRLPLQALRQEGVASLSSSRHRMLSIERAGQALQNIAIPSSSTRSRSQSLRSPFSSPTAERLPMHLRPPAQITPQMPSNLSISPRRFTVNSGNLHDRLLTPMQHTPHSYVILPSNTGGSLRTSLQQSTMASEDPCQAQPASITFQTRNPIEYTLPQLGTAQEAEDPRHVVQPRPLLAIRGPNECGRHGSAQPHMETIAAPSMDATQDNLDARLNQQMTQERQNVSAQIAAVGTNRVIVIDSDDDAVPEALVDEYEDEFLNEAFREEDDNGMLSKHDAVDMWLEEAQNSSQLQEQPGRGSPTVSAAAIEVSSQETSKSLIRIDHVANPSNPITTQSQPETTTSQGAIPQQHRLTSLHGTKEDALQENQAHLAKLDSSSVLLPSMPVRSRLPIPSAQSLATTGSSSLLDLSQIHIPQKKNFVPIRQPRSNAPLDLSALFGSSPVKVPIEAVHPPEAKPQPQPVRRDLFNSFLSIANAQTVARVASTSNHADLTCMDIEDTRAFEDGEDSTMPSLSDDRSSEPSSSSILIYPLLNNVAPLPPSAQTPSPKKSCIRTNLPSVGRNVVWAGLSPTIDTTAQTETTADISITEQIFGSGKFAQPPHEHKVPSAQESSIAQSTTPLSSTTWSKAHWKLLASIFHDARASLPLAMDLEQSYASSKLLGKVVKGESGERMVIEAWHLDVVRCFGEEVAGWDEGVVMRRVFGLVVGEGRRRGVAMEM